MIKLYTKTVCGKCMLVKMWLANSGLDYEIINTDENEEAKELVLSKGFMSAPILEVEGEFISDVNLMHTEIAELAQ